MMKRVGHLMERIAHPDNLREAFLRAARGKQCRPAVRQFRAKFYANIVQMRHELLDGSFRFGNYHFFTVFDPKRREICAAAFPERVAQHAMLRICHPVFDGYQSPDSYASRIGRGTYAALDRSLQLCRQHPWFAKLDVVHYFDSIDHDVLRGQLRRLFKDPLLLAYFDQLIDGYHGDAPGRGLPIGNLSSQYFANHYLAYADHHARRVLHAPGVVRYMDDVLLFADDRAALCRLVSDYRQYVARTLRLEHHPVVLNRVAHGIPFLGYVVRPDGLRLNLRSKRRFARKMRALEFAVDGGAMTQEEFARRAGCLLAFIEKADSKGFRKAVMRRLGMPPQGL